MQKCTLNNYIYIKTITSTNKWNNAAHSFGFKSKADQWFDEDTACVSLRGDQDRKTVHPYTRTAKQPNGKDVDDLEHVKDAWDADSEEENWC